MCWIFISFSAGWFVNTPHPKGDDEEEEGESFPTIPQTACPEVVGPY